MDAVTYTRKRRSIIYPNPGFQRQLSEYEKHVRSSQTKIISEL